MRATDAAGNTDATPASHTWTIDLTDPPAPHRSAQPRPRRDHQRRSGLPLLGLSSPASPSSGARRRCLHDLHLTEELHRAERRLAHLRGQGRRRCRERERRHLAHVERRRRPGNHHHLTPSDPSNTANPSFSFDSSEPGSTFECKLDGILRALHQPEELHGPRLAGATRSRSGLSTRRATSTRRPRLHVDVGPHGPQTTIDSSPADPTTRPERASTSAPTRRVELRVQARRGCLRFVHEPQGPTRACRPEATPSRCGRPTRPATRDATPASHTWTVVRPTRPRRRRSPPSPPTPDHLAADLRLRRRRAARASSASSTAVPSHLHEPRRAYSALRPGATPSRCGPPTRPATRTRPGEPHLDDRRRPTPPDEHHRVAAGSGQRRRPRPSASRRTRAARPSSASSTAAPSPPARARRATRAWRRVAHLRGARDRCGRQHGRDAREPHLDDRLDGAEDDITGARPSDNRRRRELLLLLEARRLELRVQARRRPLRLLHEPEELLGPRSRLPHLRGARHRRGRQHGRDAREPRGRGRSTLDGAQETHHRRRRRASTRRARASPSRQRGGLDLRVQARRRRLHRLHEPQEPTRPWRRSPRFSVRATDAAGNTDATPASHTWTIDLTAANTSITAPPSDPEQQTGAELLLHVERGGLDLRVQARRRPYASCTSPKTYTGPRGGLAHLRCAPPMRPATRTRSPASHTWTIDLTARRRRSRPRRASSRPPRRAPSFAFSNARSRRFECKLDGGAFAACTRPKGYTGLGAGSHASVGAPTPARQHGRDSREPHWTIDLTAPQTTIDSRRPSHRRRRPGLLLQLQRGRKLRVQAWTVGLRFLHEPEELHRPGRRGAPPSRGARHRLGGQHGRHAGEPHLDDRPHRAEHEHHRLAPEPDHAEPLLLLLVERGRLQLRVQARRVRSPPAPARRATPAWQRARTPSRCAPRMRPATGTEAPRHSRGRSTSPIPTRASPPRLRSRQRRRPLLLVHVERGQLHVRVQAGR